MIGVITGLMSSHSSDRRGGGGGRGHSLMWPIRGRAAEQGIVLNPSSLIRVYNFRRVCPKQGMNVS